jgi:hypothetical protein
MNQETSHNKEKSNASNCVLTAELSALIDAYKIRLAKIEKATNAISEWNQEKAWKASAAKQTKRFLTDLRRLHKICQKSELTQSNNQ